MKKCDECPEEIVFLKTRAGKNMPVNVPSLSDDDVEILGRPDGSVEYRPGEHIPHWSTCPEAAKFRRGKAL